MTAAEARKRKKATKQSLSKEERKADKVTRRAQLAERREKMMAGDDAYLLPRDKGALRRFARDVVDSRRNLLGLFMPAALALVFVMLSLPSVQIQYYVQFVMLALVAVMVVDGLLIARRVNKAVDAKFPDNTESGWKLGFYAASRASQLRRMRAPRPQVQRGAKVA
jgi:Flp pilus assembly protein TadB